ncbi:MAG TPA: hypothetical protein VGN17_01050 [Bryobacteraceae bacterium]|jgi:hypothetical protein
MAETASSYRIQLDGRWSLEDLTILPHDYLQVYAVVAHVLMLQDLPPVDFGDGDSPLFDPFLTRTERWGMLYPWAGGYSAVNFYRALVRNLTPNSRPTIIAIQYASPGYIDLLLWASAAHVVRRIIVNISKSLRELHSFYTDIYKGMQDRKLMQVDVRKRELELSREELGFVLYAIKQLEDVSGLTAEEARALKKLAPAIENGAAELGALKVFMSLIRRVRTLAEHEHGGKIEF